MYLLYLLSHVDAWAHDRHVFNVYMLNFWVAFPRKISKHLFPIFYLQSIFWWTLREIFPTYQTLSPNLATLVLPILAFAVIFFSTVFKHKFSKGQLDTTPSLSDVPTFYLVPPSLGAARLSTGAAWICGTDRNFRPPSPKANWLSAPRTPLLLLSCSNFFPAPCWRNDCSVISEIANRQVSVAAMVTQVEKTCCWCDSCVLINLSVLYVFMYVSQVFVLFCFCKYIWM